MDHYILPLSNGTQVLFIPSPSAISHACVLIEAGSRDEPPGKAGLAHFIEHMLFKRTEKRSTSQILNRLELVGADLNAYTTKEYTCLHASFMKPHLRRSLDLFEDLLFHSVFPEEEIVKEKGVVTDEIHSYQDQPEDAINDDFEDLLFRGHPLGNNILGDLSSVAAFTRDDIMGFIRKNYRPDNIVIGITGNYSPVRIASLCEELFGNKKVADEQSARGGVVPAPLITDTRRKPVSQAHCVTGRTAYSIHDERKIAFLLLNNLLGGTGMSSRLNLEIREKQGIAYTIESTYSPMSDTGIFSIYLGTDPEKIDRAVRIMHRELRKLRENRLGTLQTHQAKQRFIGQIALGEENRMGLVISMAKSLGDYGRADTLEEVIARIDSVTASQLLEIANELLDPAQFTTLLFLPDIDVTA